MALPGNLIGEKNGRYRHGVADTPLYNRWTAMRARCNNPNHIYFRHYGGRGISVCAEWQDSKAFIDWALANGYQDGLQLDRIDNDSGYSPENCRWATRSENCQNRPQTSRWLVHGEMPSLVDMARKYGLTVHSLRPRLRKMSPEEAVSKPLLGRHNAHPAPDRRRMRGCA